MNKIIEENEIERKRDENEARRAARLAVRSAGCSVRRKRAFRRDRGAFF